MSRVLRGVLAVGLGVASGGCEGVGVQEEVELRGGVWPCLWGGCACEPGCECPHQDPDNWDPIVVKGATVGFDWRHEINGASRTVPFDYEICPNEYNYGLRFEVEDAGESIHHVRLSCAEAATAEEPSCVFDGRATQDKFSTSTAWAHVGLWIEGGLHPGSIKDLVIEGMWFRGFRGRGARIPSFESVTPANYASLCPADPYLPTPTWIDDVDDDGEIDIFDHSYCTNAYDRWTGQGVDATSDGPAITIKDSNFSHNRTGLLINAQNILLDHVFAEYNEGTGIYVDHGSTAVLLSNTVRQNGYPHAACKLGFWLSKVCTDTNAQRPGIVVDGARAVIEASWIHHNGTMGIALYRNVGEFGVTDPRAWVAAAHIEGNAIHHNGTEDGTHVVKFPVPSTTWSPPIGAGIAVGLRQGISYYAMERTDGFSSGPSNRQTWIEPWMVDLGSPWQFADPEHRNYNKRDYAVAEIVDNEIFANYVGVYAASSLSAGAMVGFDYRDGHDDMLHHHRHTVSATRLKGNRFCDDAVDCAGEVDTLTEFPVFVGAPSVFENDEKYRFAGWDAFDEPVEVWGNNDFIDAFPNLRRDTHPNADTTDWDDDIGGYYGDQGYFTELDWWEVACDVEHDTPNPAVGECTQTLVRCWERDDCPTDTSTSTWHCNTSTHNCTRN